jgi:hypothetical protein
MKEYLAQVGIYEREYMSWEDFEEEAKKKEFVDELERA